jgi:hypothetical protein
VRPAGRTTMNMVAPVTDLFTSRHPDTSREFALHRLWLVLAKL